jgi:hypothetical protein
MNSNKSINNPTIPNNYKQFIVLLASYGIAQRGGVKHPTTQANHTNRLVSNVNILSSAENKQLVFSETIFSN